MAQNEKDIVGIEVVNSYGIPKPSYASHVNPSIDTLESSYMSLAAEKNANFEDEYDSAPVHPFSPFYSHPTTRTSFEQRASESKVNIAIYQHDLESGSRIAQSTDIPRGRKEAMIWPGTKQKKTLCCQDKNCRNPLRNFSKRQAIVVKVLLALLILGATVGLGIGIAKATGTGIWKNDNSQSPIGHDNPNK